MAGPPPFPDSDGDTDVGHDRGSTTGKPRWVKAIGVVAIVLVLLLVILQLAGGGHGPGRHAPSGEAVGDTPVSSVVGDRTPPDVDHW